MDSRVDYIASRKLVAWAYGLKYLTEPLDCWGPIRAHKVKCHSPHCDRFRRELRPLLPSFAYYASRSTLLRKKLVYIDSVEGLWIAFYWDEDPVTRMNYLAGLGHRARRIGGYLCT